MTAQPLVCEFVVESFFRGKRIETFLGKHLRNWSPWRLQRMVQQGCATANDAPIGCDHRVQPGERIRIRLLSPPDRAPVPEDLPVEILYEDPWLVVVNKPPGQIAHPGGDFTGRTLINGLQRHLDQQSPLPGMIRPGIVHRIDRQTSGVMVVPKDHFSHRKLTQQFEARVVSKKYVAIIRGQLAEDIGSIELPIGKVPNPTCTLMCCKSIAVGARPARTDFCVLERFSEYTFVEARPLTGRHHQIRIHFAEIGHALLADQFYDHFGIIKDGTPIELPSSDDASVGPEARERRSEAAIADDELGAEATPFFDPALPLRRHALHASELSIEHPITGLAMTFEAPLATDFVETLVRLRSQPEIVSNPAQTAR